MGVLNLSEMVGSSRNKDNENLEKKLLDLFTNALGKIENSKFSEDSISVLLKSCMIVVTTIPMETRNQIKI